MENRRLIISFGSNTPDADAKVASAINWLRERFNCVAVSPIYPTMPAGDAKGKYQNAVAVIESEFAPRVLEEMFKRYEQMSGRSPRCRENGIVPIDIDIIVDGDEVLRPWDFAQSFFRKGYESLTGTPQP